MPVDPLPDVQTIQLLLLDVDGVLTDGSIMLDETGRQLMRFHVRDGLGIHAWRTLGMEVGIVTSRRSRALTHRLRELGIDLVEQGASDKMIALENLCARNRVTPEQTAYMGDDLADLSVMCRVGYPIAVADAVDELQQVARYVTTARGGHGAVREAIEHLLKATGRWDEVLESYGM